MNEQKIVIPSEIGLATVLPVVIIG